MEKLIMIEKSEIIIGTKEEISKYFEELSASCRGKKLLYPQNLLYTKNGFIQQMDEILKVDKNGHGVMFYLIRIIENENTPEMKVTLELRSTFIKINL
jgi:hypothetical protein